MARILLIDDDFDILKIGSKLLLDLNHYVVTFDNGSDALVYMQKHSFDLVITDANMPNLSGFDVVQRIKSNPNWRHTSVALLTARNSREDVEAGLVLGVDDYMVKPIDPFVFANKVNGILEKNAPREWPEVLINTEDDESRAFVQKEILIEKVSDLGLDLLSTNQFVEGEFLKISGPLFSDLRIDVPDLKVIGVRSSKTQHGVYEVKTVYVGAKENFLRKMRSWMSKRLLKKAA